MRVRASSLFKVVNSIHSESKVGKIESPIAVEGANTKLVARSPPTLSLERRVLKKVSLREVYLSREQP